MDYKRIWQKINGRQKDSFTFSLFYRVRLFICSIYIDSSVYDCGTRIGSQILFSLFFSLTDTHTFTQRTDRCRERPHNSGCRTALVTTWPLCCEITVWACGRRYDDEAMLHDEGDDEFLSGR